MPRAKLTLDNVLEILREHSTSSSRQVAIRYGVSRCAITNLRRGWSWKKELRLLQQTGHLPMSLWSENAPPKKFSQKWNPAPLITKPEHVQNKAGLNEYVTNLISQTG